MVLGTSPGDAIDLHRQSGSGVRPGVHADPRSLAGPAGLADYRGRWLILVFYPHDFSLVCPTELVGLSQRFEEFGGTGASCWGSAAIRWSRTSAGSRRRAQGGLGGLNFPLASDTDGAVARSYGVYHELRVAMRGLFIIDPEGSCSTRWCTT